MKKFNPNSSLPLYEQLCDEIKSKIESGEYKTGDRIPSEPQLSKMYGISRITVRSGIEKLVEEKILVKKHGKGTYVAMPVHVESMSAGGSFTKSCIMIGSKPSTRVISKSIEEANSEIAKKLGINKNDKIIVIKRLRLIDNKPAIIEYDYFRSDYEFLFNQDLENTPLLDLIRRNKSVVAKKFEDIFDISYTDKIKSKLLEIEMSKPLLAISQCVIGEKDQIIYFNEQYIRCDLYKYAVRSYK